MRKRKTTRRRSERRRAAIRRRLADDGEPLFDECAMELFAACDDRACNDKVTVSER